MPSPSAMTKRERLLAACRGLPVDRPPVWLMRQAGRFLPEYRALAAQYTFLERCQRPELCAEISTQPLEALDVDAVIIFQDILNPLIPLGIEVAIAEGGPRIGNPIRSRPDLDGLLQPDLTHDLAYVGAAHRQIRERIGPEVGQIGFCGAPYTLAVYVVEGAPSKDHRVVKRLRWEEPALFRALLERLGMAMVPYLALQAEAGADVLMLFDTWASDLTPDEFEAFELPVIQRMLRALKALTAVPVIYFPRGINGYLALARETGAEVIGIDHHIALADARSLLGPGIAVQGNLDPTALYAPPEIIAAEVTRIHNSLSREPGHLFNLGHGVLPDTPVSGAQAFVRAVQALA